MTIKSPELHNSDSTSSETPWSDLSNVPFLESTGSSVSHEHTTIPDSLPTTSPSRSCNFYLREINRLQRFEDIKAFLCTAAEGDYYQFNSADEFQNFQAEYTTELNNQLDSAAQSTLKQYSGFNYKIINQVSRGYWDYETLGIKTPEKVAQTKQTIAQLSQAIQSAPAINFNFVTYRGTSLSNFRDYNVNSIADLQNLQGQFFLDEGFCSTSFMPETSFAHRDQFDDPQRETCNVAIEYLIPQNCHEGVGLLSERVSYNPEQHEYLINRDNLSYVSQVNISDDGKSAQLQMMLIPREIYDHA